VLAQPASAQLAPIEQAFVISARRLSADILADPKFAAKRYP
jgi:hypothetical protein